MTKKLDMLVSEISGLSVSSRADGTMIVRPVWLREPIEEGATPVGFMTRMWLAKRIETIILEHMNAELAELAKRKRK